MAAGPKKIALDAPKKKASKKTPDERSIADKVLGFIDRRADLLEAEEGGAEALAELRAAADFIKKYESSGRVKEVKITVPAVVAESIRRMSVSEFNEPSRLQARLKDLPPRES